MVPPEALTGEPVEAAEDAIVRAMRVWAISEETAAQMLGVPRPALSRWLVEGAPVERRDDIALLDQATCLLLDHLHVERIPEVVRRPYPAGGGRSLLDLARDGQLRRVRDDVDDMTDDAYELFACRLPPGHQVLDVHSSEGVLAAGLPATYPIDAHDGRVPLEVTQPVGVQAYDDGLDGVDRRSAATADGRGREAAWWPRGRTHVPVGGGRCVPSGRWRGSHVTDACGLLEGPEEG